MEDQFQLEGIFATGTKEGIGAERLGEELSKRLTWEDIEGGRVRRQRGRQVWGEELADLGIAGIGVEAIVADALKAFWKDMLDHAADEDQDGERFVFNLAGFMIAIPVADGMAVVAFDAVNGDRGRDNIFSEIVSKAPAVGRGIAFFDESDEAGGVIFPGLIDERVDGRGVEMLPEHG